MYGAGCTGAVWAKVAFTRDITMEWAKKNFFILTSRGSRNHGCGCCLVAGTAIDSSLIN
jgi:hypothetical protein